MKVWKGLVVLVALVVINLLMSYIVWRWDMTDDKRYSISAPTKALLQDLDAPLHITLLLDGEMNAGFLRLQKATQMQSSAEVSATDQTLIHKSTPLRYK